jgi:hypothetical protein
MPVALKNPYCTLAELCQELKCDVPTSGNDPFDELQTAINNASRYIDRYKGRDYYQHDYSSSALIFDQFSSDVFGDTIFLAGPCFVLSEVKEAGTVLVSGTDYCLADGDMTLRRLGGEWQPSRPDALVEVKCKLGFTQTTDADVPAFSEKFKFIALACRLIAAAISGHNKKEGVGLDGQKFDLIETAIPKTVYDILGRRNRILA